MSMETAIKKAIEGGWGPRGDTRSKPVEKIRTRARHMPMRWAYFKNHDGSTISMHRMEVCGDPTFWQSLCLGAKLITPTIDRHNSGKFSGPRIEKVRVTKRETWVYYWHDFIDHLASGGTPDDFFKDLLANGEK